MNLADVEPYFIPMFMLPLMSTLRICAHFAYVASNFRLYIACLLSSCHMIFMMDDLCRFTYFRFSIFLDALLWTLLLVSLIFLPLFMLSFIFYFQFMLTFPMLPQVSGNLVSWLWIYSWTIVDTWSRYRFLALRWL